MYILFWWCLHLTITEQALGGVEIANVDMKPKGKFLRFVINNTRNNSGVFLFTPDNAVALFVNVGPPYPVPGGSDRTVSLSSTQNGILTNGKMSWIQPSVNCDTNPTLSPNFEFFVYYNSQSWKVCGEGIQPCVLKRPIPYNFGPEKVSRVVITTNEVVALTTCISNTELCPV